MTQSTLEQRVQALESQYAQLAELVQQQPRRDSWRSVVGMFANDPQIEELHEQARKVREEDRQLTRDHVGAEE